MPHHISSIAHHFLLPSDQESTEGETCSLEFAVASPGGTRSGAFAAAGLLAGFSWLGEEHRDKHAGHPFLSHADLFLHEAHEPKWSAVAYLDPANWKRLEEPVVPDFSPRGPGSGASWEVLKPTISGGVESPSVRREIHVHHLGEVGDVFLEWTDAHRAVDGPRVGRPGVRTGLVWCIQDREAGSLTLALTLGRLLSALNPDHLEILVLPDRWSDDGRQGLVDRIQRLGRRGKSRSRPDPVRIQELARCAWPVPAVGVTLLELSGDGRMASGCSAALREVAGRLVDSAKIP